MTKTGIIYMATNLENQKSYVGQTKRGFYTRKSEHLSAAENPDSPAHSVFHRAIAKYGENRFEWKIVEDNIPIDLLDEKEDFYIDEFNTLTPNGYNVWRGGRLGVAQMGKSNMKGVFQIDIDTYDIISWEPAVTHMAKKLNVGASHISDICKRKPSSFTADGFTFRYDNDYSKSEVEDFLNSKRPDTKKPIVVYFINTKKIIGKYPSFYQASKELNISSGNLSDYARGERHIAGKINDLPVGCRYEHDSTANQLAQKKRAQKTVATMDMFKQPVELYDVKTNKTIQIYGSLQEFLDKNRRVKGPDAERCLVGKRTSILLKDGKLCNIRFL